MNKKSILPVMAVFLLGCGPTAEEKAAPQLAHIEQLYKQGRYQETLAAISRLRKEHPKAIKARQRALVVWQDASLRLTQTDVGRTDSALQAVSRQWANEKNLLQKNKLRVKRDSLQARYETLCGTVRVIHGRQQQLKNDQLLRQNSK